VTQTLEHKDDQFTAHTVGNGAPKRHWAALAIAAVVIVAVTALVTYALASAQTKTNTIVKTVSVPQEPTAPPVDDRGFSQLDNGHQAAGAGFYTQLDPAARAVLQHQLELARVAAMRYPTVADAEAAGWRRQGPFAPGLGAHYIKFGGTDASGFAPTNGPMTDTDVSHPLSLIYDGTQPTSRIAGLMYLGAGPRIPAGFAGQNDVWHYHTDVCAVYKPDGSTDTPFGADTTVTKKMCDGVGGFLMARTPYMLHVWVVPGYDSPEGIFSHLNEAITCRDGTYHTIKLEDIGTRRSVCVDGGE
jgi:hypothetical protein